MLNLFNKKTKYTDTLFPNLSESDFTSKNIISSKKDKDITLNEKIGETRHFPPATNEWINSIYSFNKNLIKTLPITDNIVNRLIKSYFSLSPLINKRKSKRVQIRFRRLSLNRILVSKAEMKHTNNKVIITVYLYNRNKKFLIYKLKNLYKTFVLKMAGTSAIKSKENVTKTVNIASQQKNRKNNETYKSLATSKKTSHINFKSKSIKSIKNNSKKLALFSPNTGSSSSSRETETKVMMPLKKAAFSVHPSFKGLVKVSHKKIYTTKRKPISTLYKSKVYNYMNFSNLTKERLSRFLYKIKNLNVKNKYKTLITNYYSIMSKYKLYSKHVTFVSGEGDLAPNKNYYLNAISLPLPQGVSVTFALNNNIYASTFYELLKINQNKGAAFLFKTKRKNLTKVTGDFASQYHLNKKGGAFATRKIKNLMHKLINFYKLFTLNSMYDHKPNTGIIANSTYLKLFRDSESTEGQNSKNSFFGYVTKILKKNLVTNLLSGSKALAIKKINYITLKSVRIIKRARKNKNFLIRTLNWSDKNFTNYESKYYKRFIRKAYKKEMLYLYYIRMLSLNNNKFKNWFLLGLKKVISRVYNKNVEFNLVSLKYIHLNSDIFTESIAVKLKNRQNRLLTVLKKALALVKLPSAKGKTPLYNGLDLSATTGKTFATQNKFKGLNLNTFSAMLLKNNDALHKLLLNIFTNNVEHVSHSNKLYKTSDYIGTSATQQKEVLDTIKHKAVFGVRLEAAGRLSKRLTASRSLFKLRYKGSLKNIDSSYKGISSVILKGNTKSNIQYTKINSKTRNGSFGLKGWVSSY